MVLTALVQVYCSSVFWYFKNNFYFLFLNKNYLSGYRKRNNSHLLVDLKKNRHSNRALASRNIIFNQSIKLYSLIS